MTQEEVYRIWAPEGFVWSRWVSPVLFAQIHCADAQELEGVPDVRWASWLDGSTAVVADLPSEEGVRVGLALVPKGLWPIPAYNASPGPEAITLFPESHQSDELRPSVVVNMRGIVRAICGGTSVLRNVPVTTEFRPAFLLDSLRLPRSPHLESGLFDNRWITIPQDYPSADFLKAAGITRVLLVQRGTLEPMEDLAHVVLRWQEKGIQIFGADVESKDAPRSIRVPKPRGFRASWYRVFARLGLRRNSAGGFGSHIPETSGAGG
jgi:hypothetical protein